MSLGDPLSFSRGRPMKNRFMLAPLTNTQSHADGVLSDDEFHWLTMRAKGGFGLTMTCAAHVQEVGQGFPGQLGAWGDHQLAGLARLAAAIRAEDSLAVVQLHHAGNRSPADLIGATPVCPSDDPDTGARALSTAEVEQLVEDFVQGAERAEKAGFDGVELHGAHGYILSQFFSAKINRRDDAYGGDLDNRFRILFEIIDGVRSRCGADFQLGLRLSPERFGLQLAEIKQMAERLMTGGALDYLDMSLWDCFKLPVEEAHQDKSLLHHFVELPRGNTRLGVAGKIRAPEDAQAVLDAGVDWVMLGRAAILHHDFPQRCLSGEDFEPVAPPVSPEHLKAEGLSDTFVSYMKSSFKGFVADG